jgi:hypothetical protein
MDILKMLAELRAEREQIEEAIAVIERLALGGAKRRGRPPKWMSERKENTAQSAAPKPKRVLSYKKKTI